MGGGVSSTGRGGGGLREDVEEGNGEGWGRLGKEGVKRGKEGKRTQTAALKMLPWRNHFSPS